MTDLSTHEAALEYARTLDAADLLAAYRKRFALPDGIIYLDGNSLGALPVEDPRRLQKAAADEWGVGLIRSWNDADWYPAPQRVGAKIARVIGALASEVIACDSTTVNVFKVLSSAVAPAPIATSSWPRKGTFRPTLTWPTAWLRSTASASCWPTRTTSTR